MFFLVLFAYFSHSEDDITFHLYAEAERTILMDSDTSYEVFKITGLIC